MQRKGEMERQQINPIGIQEEEVGQAFACCSLVSKYCMAKTGSGYILCFCSTLQYRDPWSQAGLQHTSLHYKFNLEHQALHTELTSGTGSKSFLSFSEEDKGINLGEESALQTFLAAFIILCHYITCLMSS